MVKPLWQYIPIVGYIGSSIRRSRASDRLIELSMASEFGYDERSEAQRLDEMDQVKLDYCRYLGFTDEQIITFDFDKLEYEIPREHLPEPIRVERRKIAQFIGGMEVNIFDNRTIAERIAAMDQRELAYFRSLYIPDTKIVGLFLDQAGYPIPEEFEPDLENAVTADEVVAAVASDVDGLFEREQIADDPTMAVFSLADLGLSDEEIAALDEPWPPAPRVAQQLSAADLARLQNMDSTQLQAAHALDLSDAEILELGLDRLFPLGIRSEGTAIFSLADLGLTFSEIYDLHEIEGYEEIYKLDAIRNGILDRRALEYIRRHPEIVPPPAPPARKQWLAELPLDVNLFLNHIRFENWLRIKREVAEQSGLTVLQLVGNSSIHDLVREYLNALDEARRSEQAWAYYPTLTLDEVPSEVVVRAEWANDLRVEAERLLALCESALQVEAGVYRRREIYAMFGAKYEGECLCGPRLELEAIALQIQAAARDDARYSEALSAAYADHQKGQTALTQLNVRLVAEPALKLKRYRFLLVGNHDLSVFVDAQNPQDAIANLLDEKVVSGETPQAKRRARQAGHEGWCHSTQYISTLVLRELPYDNGPMLRYRFSIYGGGDTFSCRIDAASFYEALDLLLTGKKQLTLEGRGLMAGGQEEVFNFNVENRALAMLATLTPENTMAWADSWRIRWSLV